ncbi:MAG: hypothetical protein LBR40_03675 [Bacilli bacterium]|nr:hypothetical protein [Bacilli bacterium]
MIIDSTSYAKNSSQKTCRNYYSQYYSSTYEVKMSSLLVSMNVPKKYGNQYIDKYKVVGQYLKSITGGISVVFSPGIYGINANLNSKKVVKINTGYIYPSKAKTIKAYCQNIIMKKGSNFEIDIKSGNIKYKGTKFNIDSKITLCEIVKEHGSPSRKNCKTLDLVGISRTY